MLVCFPYAGAGVSAFAPWGRRLSPRLELHIARLPGRGGRLREPPETQLAPVIRSLCDAVTGLGPRPMVFFGHSLGAMMAYEVSRELHKRGASLPIHLVVSSRSGPTFPDPRQPLHGLSDDAFLEAMSERYGGIPDVIRREPELLALFLPSLRADMTLHETYRHTPGAPLPIPISAWCGQSDPGVSAESLASWSSETRAAFSQRWFEGGHFYIQPQAGPVLDALAAVAG